MAIYCANCLGTDHTESDPECPDNAGKPCHDVAPDGESHCVFGKGHAVRYHSKYPLEWWDGKWLKTSEERMKRNDVIAKFDDVANALRKYIEGVADSGERARLVGVLPRLRDVAYEFERATAPDED